MKRTCQKEISSKHLERTRAERHTFAVLLFISPFMLSLLSEPPLALWTKETTGEIQDCVVGAPSFLLLREPTQVEILDEKGSPLQQVIPPIDGISGWAVSPATPFLVLYGFTEESSRALLLDFHGKSIKEWEEKEGDYFWAVQWSSDGKKVAFLVAKPPPEEDAPSEETSSNSQYSWVLRITDEKGALILETSPITANLPPLWGIASDTFFFHREVFHLPQDHTPFSLSEEFLQDVRQFQFNGHYLAISYRIPPERQESLSLLNETGQILWTRKMQAHILRLTDDGNMAVLAREGFSLFNSSGDRVLNHSFPHPMAALDVEANSQKSIYSFSYRIPKHYVKHSPEVVAGENPYLPRIVVYALSRPSSPLLQFKESEEYREQIALSRNGKILFTCGGNSVSAYPIPGKGIWQSFREFWKRFFYS